MGTYTYTAEDAKRRLIEGNQKYVESKAASLNVSDEIRKASVQGQKPYAVVISCADSRVIPEAIFSAGIGDLFVLRVAGNVLDTCLLGSIEYAVEHLGTGLIVVLGHDHCGAVKAAMHHQNDGCVKYVTDEILKAIGSERDETKACRLNVKHSCRVIESSLQIEPDGKNSDLTVIGAVYHLESGRVEFIQP